LSSAARFPETTVTQVQLSVLKTAKSSRCTLRMARDKRKHSGRCVYSSVCQQAVACIPPCANRMLCAFLRVPAGCCVYSSVCQPAVVCVPPCASRPLCVFLRVPNRLLPLLPRISKTAMRKPTNKSSPLYCYCDQVTVD
jgi:hypothetical protein